MQVERTYHGQWRVMLDGSLYTNFIASESDAWRLVDEYKNVDGTEGYWEVKKMKEECKMDIVNILIMPVGAVVDLNCFGMVTGAKDQLKNMNLGDFLLLTDYLTRHDRINSVGDKILEKMAKDIKETDEYKYVMSVMEV